MKRNVKKVRLVLNEISIRKFKTIPTLKNLLHTEQLSNLKLGDNDLYVNHFVFSKLVNFAGIGSYKVLEVKYSTRKIKENELRITTDL